MFKLENKSTKACLTLEIIGYQFPDDPQDDWCNLKAIVEHEDHQTELVDPAIETTELIELLDWFTCLSEGRLPSYSHLNFIEPCISFEFLAVKDGEVKIAVKLAYELYPNFDSDEFLNSENVWVMVFELDSTAFQNTIEGIKNTLEKYPVRGQD